MRRRGLLELLIVCGLAACLSMAMTWPLPLQMDRVGRVDTGDGQFSIWNVAWVARALLVDPGHVFDANIFSPHRGTLAYAESNLGAGLLAIPFYWGSGKNPYFAHNAVFLLSLALALVSMYYLVRHLAGSRAGAAVAAILFAFCPYVFAHTAHIQLLLTAGLPLSMLAFHRLVDRPEPARAVMLGIALFATAMTSGYHGIFAALLVAFGSLFYLVARRYWRHWSYYVALLFAAGISMALIWPFFEPYLGLESDGRPFRKMEEAYDYSASLSAYLASGGLGSRWMLPYLGKWSEVLFPGFLAIILGTLGAWAGWRAWRERPASPADAASTLPMAQQRVGETALFYGLVTLAAFWISFGPQAWLYQVLYQLLPVFSFLRAPSRMGLIVVMGLSVLAAIFLARVAKGSRREWAVGLALGLVALLELTQVPLRFREVSPPSPIHRLLATLPRDPVVEFPFFFRRIDFHRHTLYMLNSTVHWQPLVNGYSDFFPRDFLETVDAISSFPTRESFDLLRKRRARYVVFHFDFYDWRSREKVKARIEEWREYLRLLARDGTDELYEIVKWPM